MLPDRVSNPGPPTYESGALPIALRGPARAAMECHDSLIVCTVLRENIRTRAEQCRPCQIAKNIFLNSNSTEQIAFQKLINRMHWEYKYTSKKVRGGNLHI